jgi:multisubunit Na+/H+ antiporter MnhF subunit
VNVWMWGSILMLAALVPCGYIVLTSSYTHKRLVALEMTGIVAVAEMMLLTMAFNRMPMMDLPVALALLSFGGGIVFAHFLERHL